MEVVYFIAITFFVVGCRKISGLLQNYYNLENITSFTTELHAFPTMYFELDFHVEFPFNVCCPLVLISVHRNSPVFAQKCYEDVTQHENWYKNALFNLQTGKEGISNVKYTLNSSTAWYRSM